jgi:hypothetical protein
MRGVFRSVDDLKAAINRFVAETNADPKPHHPSAATGLRAISDEQRARLSGEAATRTAALHGTASTPQFAHCGAAAIDWSTDQIDKSVQPTEQQPRIGNLQQAFGNAASDLRRIVRPPAPQSAVTRLETIEARPEATWRAILSIQVVLNSCEG